ncbi:calcium-binding mitochondrial carrier protein Aralar1-like [Actinia tenebrosa]|uniref:Calcium-binding mitochondrial carrier protein Aralar1-like n=1 Tax=Actinia tenebrosa TaxID=6105 RepID=A0A6P8J4E0_ACTTE|nr:calcium-binding mitochondrial carrier protein Aralar1-like [Actinia tenebrosa]
MLEEIRRKDSITRNFGWPLVSRANCKAIIVDYSVRPADPKELQRIFNKYATVEQDGQKYMTPENLIRDYLGMQKIQEYDETTLSLLAGVVDQTKDGLISFSEFVAFEGLLRDPDSYHKLIFQLFDLDGKGSVSFDEFQTVIKKTKFYDKLEFHFESELINSYFGAKKDRCVPFHEFSHLLQDFEKEYQRQAFFYAKMSNGEIPATRFAEIMKTLRGHLLTPYVRAYLLTVAGGEARHRVSYGYYRAFNSMLDNILILHDVSNKVAKGKRYKEIKKEDFLHEVLKTHPEVTPLQVDILYHLCDVDRRGRITISDIHHILPKHDVFKVFSTERHDEEMLMEPDEKQVSFIWSVLHNVYRFGLGSIAGATGATAVYPIDLVKTRMQNQRAVLDAEKLYKNSFDCLIKVIRNEGIRGLYRGLLPQLVGVSPEKAIKLTTNDMVRGFFSDNDGFISLPYEIIAGGCGGAAQVLFTNPLEIVKIRLQVAGEQPGKKVTALACVKELGVTGLYKGARACFLRDIPFSGIYFSAYAHLKLNLADENGHNGAASLFAAAMMAAINHPLNHPPFILSITLSPVSRSTTSSRSDLIPTNPDLSLNPDHIGGMRVAVATYAGIETRFGLCLPKFRTPQKMTLNPIQPEK